MIPPIFLPVQHAQQPPVRQTYDGGLTVSAPTLRRDLVNHVYEWSDGVQATYDVDTVRADRLVIHDGPDEQYAEAFGNVTLTDPEGTISAAYLKLVWKDHTGSARDVLVRTGKTTIRAESIDIGRNVWTLRNVALTGCTQRVPFYYVRAREVSVRPGIGGRAERPSLDILGHHVLNLPTQKFSYGGGGGYHLPIPIPSFRAGKGIGLSWDPAIPLSEETRLYPVARLFPKNLPYYSAGLVHSFIPGRIGTSPRSGLGGDRYSYGYFNNVQAQTPNGDVEGLRHALLSFSVNSSWGIETVGTTDSRKVNRPYETSLDGQTAIAGLGVFAELRNQRIGYRDGPYRTRTIGELTVGSPRLYLGRALSLIGRVDSSQYFTSGNYRVLRGEIGAVLEPKEGLRFAASYAASKDFGTPNFPFDVLDRRRQLNFRLDYGSHSTELRLLAKYDPDRRDLFDREIFLSQEIGCLAPFVLYRSNPHRFIVGLKLPITRDLQALSQRQIKRRNVISELPKRP